MSHATPAPLDRAVHTARAWIADVAAQFDTEDMSFAYRVTRAWLHTVRDRLPVVDAAHFGAQLPEILRGVYYEGWDPAKVPVKYDRGQFTARFATDARISEPTSPRRRTPYVSPRPAFVRASVRGARTLPHRPAHRAATRAAQIALAPPSSGPKPIPAEPDCAFAEMVPG